MIGTPIIWSMSMHLIAKFVVKHFLFDNRDEITKDRHISTPRRGEMSFVKRYFFSLVALAVALIVLFFLLNLGRRAPGGVGTAFDKVGQLSTGQAYGF